jgi:WD40 repeat protein
MKEITGKRVFTPFHGHKAAVTCITFCPDGKRVLTGSADHTLRLWDVAGGQGTIHTLEGHRRPVSCLAVSPDGRLAASADGGADVLVWDLDRGRRIRTLDNPRGVRSLGFSDDGRKILCGLDRPEPSDGETVCCTLHSVPQPGEAPRRPILVRIPMEQAVTAVARSSDGQRVVLGGDSMLWVIEVRRKGSEAGTLSVEPRRLGPPPGTVHRIVFSRDGRRFVASAQKAAYLFGVESTPLLVKSPVGAEHVCACFSEDEKQLLLARQHGGDADAELAPLPDRAEASLDPSRNKP